MQMRDRHGAVFIADRAQSNASSNAFVKVTLKLQLSSDMYCTELSTHKMLIYFIVGRVRTTLVPPPAGESSPHTVSLSVLSPQVQSHPDENKCVFRFEASWDSSLHNSILLNR